MSFCFAHLVTAPASVSLSVFGEVAWQNKSLPSGQAGLMVLYSPKAFPRSSRRIASPKLFRFSFGAVISLSMGQPWGLDLGQRRWCCHFDLVAERRRYATAAESKG
jgi:hypothetical protein